MGVIKINNIIDGSNNSADIIYKNTTVEEKLNSIPVFDPSDNANIEANQYDYLTYGHIVNTLNSSDSNKVLSANQGKVLSEKIDNIDLSHLEDGIAVNAENISNLNKKTCINSGNYTYACQDDGNFVIYDKDVNPIFDTQTADFRLSTLENLISNKKNFNILDTNPNYTIVRPGESCYYFEIGDYVFVSLYLMSTKALTAGTQYKITTDLPRPITYHAVAACALTVNIPAIAIMQANGTIQTRVYTTTTAATELIAQFFYKKA